MVLGRFVEFGEAAAVGAGGCGRGDEGSSTSFGTILWVKSNKLILCLYKIFTTVSTLCL